MNSPIVTADVLDVAERRWRHVRTSVQQPLVIGVIPRADGANSMVVQARRGNRVYRPDEFTEDMDGQTARDRVLDIVNQYRLDDEQVHVLMSRTDLGNTPFDFLKLVANRENIALYSVLWWAKPPARSGTQESLGFDCLRSSLMFEVKKRLCAGIAMQQHERRRKDLLAPIGAVDASGKYVAESREETRRRTGETVPFYDALALTLAIEPTNSRRPQHVGHVNKDRFASATAA